MYLIGTDAQMITLSRSKNILKPPPVCKKGQIPPAAASLYPGPQMQAWVYAADLRPSPNDLIVRTVVLQKVQSVPQIFSIDFIQAGVRIILTMVYIDADRTFDLAWSYIEGVTLIDSANTGPVHDDSKRSFDTRIQNPSSFFGRIDFQARITR